MFEFFPGNYVWNLGVVAALNSGGLIDEVDRACRPIREAAAKGADGGTGDFLRAWTALTDQLVGQAQEAEKAGHFRTAGQLYFRATNYLAQSERMLPSLTRTGFPRTSGSWSWRRSPSISVTHGSAGSRSPTAEQHCRRTSVRPRRPSRARHR